MKKIWPIIMIKLLITLLIANISVLASSSPYIPSYDDRYQEDIQQASKNKNFFIEPSDNLNYAHYHYVGAHDAEKYPRFFDQYILQEQTIPGMLALGARGLMLSVYNWSLNWSSLVSEGISIVCSHPTDETKVFRKNGKPLYQTLHYEMNRIFNFLKANPKAVITIFLNDYADAVKIERDMKEIIMKNNYDPLLKPSDWPVAQQKGEWPTLGWMRQHNKRLILFTQIYKQHTPVTWPVEGYFWENNYGTTDEKILCDEEKELVVPVQKRNRNLVSFGCFGSVASVAKAKESRNPFLCFSYEFAKRATLTCQKRRFAYGKLFNAYWVDHIIDSANGLDKDRKKTVFDYVNELNANPPKNK